MVFDGILSGLHKEFFFDEESFKHINNIDADPFFKANSKGQEMYF